MTQTTKHINLLLTASLLLAGFVSSTHVHRHAASVGEHETQAAPVSHCCCHGHTHSASDNESSKSDQTPTVPCEPDHDCSICRLLANFCAAPSLTFDFTFHAVTEPSYLLTTRFLQQFSTTPIRPRGPPTI